MDDFMLVIDYFITVLNQFFSLMISNWFFGFIFLVGIFTFIINLVLIIKGAK